MSPEYSNSKYVISVNNQGTTTAHPVYMDSVLTIKWQYFIAHFSHYITLCKSLLLCSQCYMFVMKSLITLTTRPVPAGPQPPSQSSICMYLCLIILSTETVSGAKRFFQEDPYIALDNDAKVRVTQM